MGSVQELPWWLALLRSFCCIIMLYHNKERLASSWTCFGKNNDPPRLAPISMSVSLMPMCYGWSCSIWQMLAPMRWPVPFSYCLTQSVPCWSRGRWRPHRLTSVFPTVRWDWDEASTRAVRFGMPLGKVCLPKWIVICKEWSNEIYIYKIREPF